MQLPLSAERRPGVILALGIAQTLVWGSTYYLPAILAMARKFDVSAGWVYGAFSISMLITALLGPSGGTAGRVCQRDPLANFGLGGCRARLAGDRLHSPQTANE